MEKGTEIGKVRGLGSAKSGAEHWLVQRYTAMANLVLGSWLVASLIMLPDLQFSTVKGWLAAPVPLTAMVLLVISMFTHVQLGLQVLFEDYVADDGDRFAVLASVRLASWAGMVFALVCLLTMALGGRA